MIKNIFNIIKNEEITIFQRAVGNTVSESISNGQLNSSYHSTKLLNLSDECFKAIFGKFKVKLQEDKLQSQIKKDSSKLINLMDDLLEDILDVIKKAHVDSSNSQYNDEYRKKIDETFQPPLKKLKDELIDGWNVQAKIETTKKQNKFICFLITGVFTVLIIDILAGLIVNWISPFLFSQNTSNKSQQNIIIQKTKNHQ